MLLAHVRPPPLPPPSHDVLHWPRRSHCSDSQTGTLVFMAPLPPPVYVCVVTALSIDSAPALLIWLSMLTWLPQPSDSQQAMPTWLVRLLVSSVLYRILMKSAAW